MFLIPQTLFLFWAQHIFRWISCVLQITQTPSTESNSHSLSVWILVLSEYNPMYSESPYKRKAAVNCLVAQQEESWQHYKLLVQHLKSAAKKNAWEEIQYCKENIAWARKRHFSGMFSFSTTFSLKEWRSVLTPLV